MCLNCTEAQDFFTRLSIPGLIRAKLIEFPSITFSGEFAELREFLANAKTTKIIGTVFEVKKPLWK